MPLLNHRYDALRARIDQLEVGDFIFVGSKWREVTKLTRRNGRVFFLQFVKVVRNRFADHETGFQRHEFAQKISAVAKRGEELPDLFNPVVYFARDCDLVKIGFTGQLRNRLVSIKSKIGGRKLELLGTLPGGRELERQLHTRFAHLRQHGEWFTLTDEIREFIASDPIHRTQPAIASAHLADEMPSSCPREGWL